MCDARLLQTCEEGQYFDGIACENCISNCKNCTTGSDCEECFAGFTVKTENDITVCFSKFASLPELRLPGQLLGMFLRRR